MRRKPSQRGAAAIEFAIVLLILLPLAFGVTEFGRAFFQYNTLVKATRDGARRLVADCTSNTDTARKFTVYGSPTDTGDPLVPGLAMSMVKVTCDQTVTYTGGSFKAATISIEGFTFKSLVPGMVDDISFARISATMRQG